MGFIFLKEKDFNPSTVTMVSNFNKSINSKEISEFLPVVHLFDKSNERLKLVSGSRNSIKYYGHEGIIISVCYKNIRRGMRTGAMNNMVSVDLQYKEKNIHVKISSTTMTSVGTSSFEFGNEVFNIMIRHINMLNGNIRYIRNSPKDVLDKNIFWIFENCCDEHNNLISIKTMSEKLLHSSHGLDERIVKSCIVYLDDFEKNETGKFKEKIIRFCNKANYFEESLCFIKSNIFNSVYHINIFEDNEKRIPLHKLAPYLAEKNFIVEFHNWTSEGVNVCFDIEEEKSGIHHNLKDYKHRFTIHERGTIRQCSPTFKKESYRYYLGLIKQIHKFFEEKISENYLDHVVVSKMV